MKLLLQHPTKVPQINQGFGDKTDPAMLPKYITIGLKGHNGLDYQAPEGTPIMAMHDGTVVYAGLDGSNGNLIVIMTDKMFDYKDGEAFYKTYYGHLQTGSFKVTAGQKVKCGDVIACAGNTGMSFGAHLHMGLKPVQKGENDWTWYNLDTSGFNGAIDPAPYLPPVEEFQSPIKFGDESYDVEKLQAFLIRNKYMQPVSKLGYFGKITQEAVLKFQIEHCNLSWYERTVLKGRIVGTKTIKKLNELY
jgi:hypothetical protein